MKRFLLTVIAIAFFASSIKSQEVKGIIISDTANLTVIKIWGSHEERGFAYGYLLGEEISNMVTGYMLPSFGTHMEDARQLVIEGKDLRFDSVFVAESMAVVEGMDAAGTNYANIDYIDGLVFNAFLDIVKLLGMTTEKPGCSSLMSWGDATAGTDLDGRSVISRHLDWSPHPVIIQNQVMAIHVPSEPDEQPWVMVGFAGQMSVLSGFNANMAVFQHMMSDFTGVSNHGVEFEPVWLTLRKAIEKVDFNNDGQHNTMDVWDAVAVNQTGYADGYILTALAPSTAGADSLIALVAEVAPQEPYITFRSNAYPDDIPGDNLYAANYEIRRNNHNHYCSRYYAVMNALDEGLGIGSEENWQIMRDNSNGATGNIQFMQFIPETDMFRITVHRNGAPAYQQEPVDFVVSELLYHPVGIDVSSFKNGLHLYPNPVSDFLCVDVFIPFSNYNYSICNLYGKKMLNGKLNGSTGKIELYSLPSGIYFFKMGESRVVKFIKL